MAGDVTRWETNGGIRIYRIPTRVLPHLDGFVHLILGNDFVPTLIDAGGPREESLAGIDRGLAEVTERFAERFRPEDIGRIIVTHAHLDHFGGAARLAGRSGAEVWSHRFDSRIVESFNERSSVANRRYADFLREAGVEPERIDPILNGFGFLPGRANSVPVARRLDDGEVAGPFRFHHFPGHSAGLLAVEVGDFLLTGDLLLSQTLTQIWPEKLIPFTGLFHYLDSLSRLNRFVADAREAGRTFTLLPGHEDPVTNVARRIELVKKSTERRANRIFDILDRCDEPPTIWQLSRKMYLTAHESRTFFAVCDVAARLEYLQLQGELAVANYDDIAAGRTDAFCYAARRPSVKK